MTIKNLSIFLFAILICVQCFAQEENSEFKYRRSSLHTMMVQNPTIVLADDSNLPIAKITRKSFTDSPFPSKYDNHDISTPGISYKYLTLIESEEEDNEKKSEKTIGPNGKSINKKDSKNIEQIQNYLKQNKIANKMVAKWFNQKPDGLMDQELIIERGWNNATEADVAKLSMLEVGLTAQFENAGLELIGNTFIVVNQYKFVDNEFVARPVYEAAVLTANEIENPTAKNLALKAAEKLYQKAQGYSIRTKAYLFKLAWNDSIIDPFYDKMYCAKGYKEEEKQQRKELFDKSELFHFEFVGVEKNTRIITSKLDPEKAISEEQKIQQATTRAIDQTYALLQKEYDVFKPLSQLVFGEKAKNCSAKIGTKEGLEGGEKFDVLKPSFNSKTGRSEFKTVGTIKVDKKNVWDNQYYVGEGPTLEGDEVAIQATKFKGCKGSYTNFFAFIRQTK